MKNFKIITIMFAALVMLEGCKKDKTETPAMYPITVSADSNGSAVATSGDKPVTEAAQGTEITIKATQEGDYGFKHWVIVKGPAELLSDKNANPAEFKMPAEKVEIKAEFEAVSRTVKVSGDENGTAVATPADATAGTQVTITATPIGNYKFKQWVVIKGGEDLIAVKTENPAEFTMPAGDVEIKAEFEVKDLVLTNDGNGTAVADPADATAGMEVTITAMPEGDYNFKEWVVVKGGEDLLAGKTTTNPSTFTMPIGKVEIKAEFEAVVRTVMMRNDGKGTASADPINATAGMDVTITATPGGDLMFKQWVVLEGGEDLLSGKTTVNPATFTMPAGEVVIRAEFGTISEIIPDPNFRKYCLESFDKNQDNLLSSTELAAATGIYVRELGITSLKGLEYFTELLQLDCLDNSLTELDISKNVKLTKLISNDNSLTSLDLSQNINLIELYCLSIRITSLDVSNNKELLVLNCAFNNSLAYVDVSNNTKLKSLDCRRCPMEFIDISENKELTDLDCRGMPKLKTIWVWDGFDVDNLPAGFTTRGSEFYQVKK